MVTVTAWAQGAGLAIFWFIKRTISLRASQEEEMEGLDMPEHGMLAYPEQDMGPTSKS